MPDGPSAGSKLKRAHLSAGKTLAEADLRRRYGVLVQAVLRSERLIRFPNAETFVCTGDRLMVCGSSEDIERLKQVLEAQPSQLS